MLRQRRLREADQLGEFADAEFLSEQVTENQQALWIGHGAKQFSCVIGAGFEFSDIHIDILEYSNIYVNRTRGWPGAAMEIVIMQNVGTPDRIVRLVLGAFLIIAPFVTGWTVFAGPWMLWGSVVVGTVLVATAHFSFCPIYAALGLSTRPKRLS